MKDIEPAELEVKSNKVTYGDIQKANESIKTTAIKGKDYAEVNQRIKAFRMVYPTGTIETEMLSNENGVCVFQAEVRDENGKLLATGTAYEKENSTFINKTSYIENCETSAIGRALGIAGFGIDTSVASAEEVQNAINNQGNNGDLMNKIKTLALQTETDLDAMIKYYGVNSTTEMTDAQLKDAISKMEMKIKK